MSEDWRIDAILTDPEKYFKEQRAIALAQAKQERLDSESKRRNLSIWSLIARRSK